MLPASNFDFLDVHDPVLVRLGALAERYFRDDPATTIIKLRQLAELVANLIAAHHTAYPRERQTFEETLRQLAYDRLAPKRSSKRVAWRNPKWPLPKLPKPWMRRAVKIVPAVVDIPKLLYIIIYVRRGDR